MSTLFFHSTDSIVILRAGSLKPSTFQVRMRSVRLLVFAPSSAALCCDIGFCCGSSGLGDVGGIPAVGFGFPLGRGVSGSIKGILSACGCRDSTVRLRCSVWSAIRSSVNFIGCWSESVRSVDRGNPSVRRDIANGISLGLPSSAAFWSADTAWPTS